MNLDTEWWKRDCVLASNREVIDSIELLSLDVFDTLLFRTVRKPIDVFDLVGSKAVETGAVRNGITSGEFKQVRVLAEKRARSISKIRAGSDEVKLEDIYAEFPRGFADVETLINLEIEAEKESCFVNPHIYSLAKHVHSLKKPIVLISDMYLSDNQICTLLQSSGISTEWVTKVYVSSQYGHGKRSGELFREMLADFSGIKGSSILHIGDHIDADVISPRKLGIQALHYDVISSQSDATYEWEDIRHGNILPELLSLRKLAASSRYELKDEDLFWYRLGASHMGPFFSAFADWIVDCCRKEGKRGIFPLMREGYLLTGVLKRAVENACLDITVKPIYVSRQATYLASLSEFNEEQFVELFERTHLKIKELFNILHLGDFAYKFSMYLEEELGKSNEIILPTGLSLKQELLHYLLSPEAQGKITRAIVQERDLLVQYLLQECGPSLDIVTVDLGFKGTIQKAIEAALQKKDVDYNAVHFLAFGAEATKSCLLDGLDVRGFVGNAGENKDIVDVVYRSPEVLEELTMGDIGSTLGYVKKEGQIIPRLYNLKITVEEVRKKKICQEGIMQFQHYWQFIKSTKRFNPQELFQKRVAYGSLIHRVIDMPTPQEATYLGSLTHDDNHGSENASHICNKENFSLFDDVGTEQFLNLCAFGYRASKVYWPQGVVTVRNPAYLFQVFAKQRESEGHLIPMNQVINRVKSDGNKEIIVYGAGEVGQTLVKVARLQGLQIEAVVDQKRTLWGNYIEGIEIVSLEEAMKRSNHVYVIGSLSFIEDITHDINMQYKDRSHRPIIYSAFGRSKL